MKVSAPRSTIDFAGPLSLMRETRLDETFEKRMRLVRLALKLGVILAGEKVRMVAQLNQLRERSVWRRARNRETLFAHPFAILHVEFVAVPVSLQHFAVTINFFRDRSFGDFRRPRPESHT